MEDSSESFIEIIGYGHKYWKNPLRQSHRIDGSKYWYINDIELTEEEFESFTNNFGMVWNEETKIAFKLIYQT